MAYDGAKHVYTLQPDPQVYKPGTVLSGGVPQAALQAAYSVGRYAGRLVGIETYASNLSPVGTGTATKAEDVVFDTGVSTSRVVSVMLGRLPPFPGEVRVSARIQFKHVGPYDASRFVLLGAINVFDAATVPGGPTLLTNGTITEEIVYKVFESQRETNGDLRSRDGIYSTVITTGPISWSGPSFPGGPEVVIEVKLAARKETGEAMGLRPVSTIVLWEIDD